MDTSLYFHIPFCRRRCGYCDFNTFEGMKTYIPEYVDALCREVEIVLARSPEPVIAHTIYFGGGTPSLLSGVQFSKILESVRNGAEIANNAEISLEANPETVSMESMQELRDIGFTRVSIGMQSVSAQDLRVLDRQHYHTSVIKAVEWSRQAGFEHINLDLMFGIPRQSLESWLRTVTLALSLGADHFSIYSLILEDGTRLKRWVERGLVELPDDDLAGEMYDETMSIMKDAGFTQYEISNWSRGAGAVCRHNLQYWHYLPYLGFGVGAHGFWGKVRVENASLIPQYIESIVERRETEFPAGPACEQFTRLSAWEMIQENLMVSLRLTDEGVSITELHDRYGVWINELFHNQIEKLTWIGLLEFIDDGNRMRLTRKGRLFGNRVFSEFIANQVPKGLEFLDN